MARITKPSSKNKRGKLPEKARDMPATVGLVYEVRDELKTDIRALEARMEARFSGQEGRFSRIDERLASLEEKFERSLASNRRVEALFEEQRSENRVMFEALKGHLQMITALTSRVDTHDDILRELARSRH